MFCNCGTGAGAVYRARLESVCWVKPTEGSNPSLSVALARTGCLTSRRGRTDGSQGNGGPIPPCPTLLRPAVAGLRRAGRTGCFTSRKGRTDGAGAGLRGHIAGARSAQIDQPRGVPAKISGQQGINPDRNLSLKNSLIPPRRWVFRSNAEACMNNAVALQRQPYLGVGCLGRVRFASGPFGSFKGCCRPDIRPVLRVGDQTPTHWIGINIGPLLT